MDSKSQQVLRRIQSLGFETDSAAEEAIVRAVQQNPQWPVSTLVRYCSNLEEVDPDLDEETALKNTERIRAQAPKSGSKNPRQESSPITKRLLGIKEGMDDADDGEHLEVSGPDEITNPLAEIIDAVEGAAQRAAGLVNRRANLDLSSPQAKKMLQDLDRIQMELSDIVYELDDM